MRQAPEHIQALLEPVISSMGYELVGIDFQAGSGGLLRIYIDREQGITVDDCARVSHQVSGVLDVEDPLQGSYTLEVSSPGLDRPLFTLEQFRHFIGHQVKLRLRMAIDGRRRFSGTIVDVGDKDVTVAIDGEQQVISLDMIEKANLVPEFQQ